VWRVLTSMLYFGDLNITTCLRLMFMYRFSSKLENYTFRGNSINYLYFILLGTSL
jgi:Derlin-2/3